MKQPEQSEKKAFAIILAAGKGSRMAADINKMLLPLGDRTVLEHSCLAFERLPEIQGYLVCAAEPEIAAVTRLLIPEIYSKLLAVIVGGKNRSDSVRAGLEWLRNSDIDREAPVLIHDGTRALVTSEVIRHCLSALAQEICAVAAAVPVADTIRQVDDQGWVRLSPDRSYLRAMQTPQGASLELLLAAFSAPQNLDHAAVDDVGILLKIGCPLRLVAGDPNNLKITTPTDLMLAELLLAERQSGTDF
ncbi:MAG: 2-C-methyl-D-erythritol 4-phosphate cytidylyltransferase [Clostridiales bacterium]|nr:2-C-methyl-D-erythritol 4-phosphate cytidylyltransferase [Clostridiales bacterium]